MAVKTSTSKKVIFVEVNIEKVNFALAGEIDGGKISPPRGKPSPPHCGGPNSKLENIKKF